MTSAKAGLPGLGIDDADENNAMSSATNNETSRAADGAYSSASLAQRTFEDLVTELESVATAMDRGDIGIEEAAELYSRAAALHEAASTRLETVQARLAQLRGDS
jgi:exodeoxyribonuclease VII small subunit